MNMELMDCDLHRIIQSKQPLNDMHYKCFAKQMLEGIRAMHEIGVFHRDLKPGNLLVSKDCQLRITDFGLARFMDEDTLSGNNRQNPLTEYVVTRWYRCPELLLSPTQPYSAAIDIWSIGCILGELIKRKPLFPGKSHANQVQLILEVRGYHGPEDLGFELSSEATSFLDRRCRFNGKPLASFIPQASPEALELLEVLMDLNPKRRPSAAEALTFSYIEDAQILCDYSENTMPRRVDERFFDFEREDYSLEQLQAMVREEVNRPCDDSIFVEPSPTRRTTSLSRQASGSQQPSHGRTESDVYATEEDEDRVEYSRQNTLERSESLMSECGPGANPKTLSRSRSAPPTPSPQKVDIIAKQDKKHKRRFFLQGLQRLKQDQEVVESSSSRSEKDSGQSTNRIERYGTGSEDLTSRRDRAQPPGVVRGGSTMQQSLSNKASKYAQPQEMGDQSHLYSQFHHLGFSSEGRNAAPVADSRVTRLPALHQRGPKQPGFR